MQLAPQRNGVVEHTFCLVDDGSRRAMLVNGLSGKGTGIGCGHGVMLFL